MVFHTSFINGIIQYKNLPRHMFGNLQSKQFPPYFFISFIGSAFLTASTAYIAGFQSPMQVLSALSTASVQRGDAIQIVSMAASSLGTLLNLVYVGPKSTKVMFDRHKLEKANAPVPPEMNTTFAWLHGVSSLLNLGLVITCAANSLWVGSQWTALLK
ncbi:hypothetical protein BC829DRAFT_384539 [Chytridium lagenaria]|nr:hypothetical protein BC829DRAFT_384539 [Chytridium lagenaria]